MRILKLSMFTGCTLGLMISAQGALAQTSFLNIDVPVEEAPAAETPAPMAPQAIKPAAAPAFPQCAKGQYTSRSETVGQMIEHALGFKSPFSKKLVDKTGKNGFTLFNGSGELQVRATVEGSPYDLAGSACQAGDGLIVKLVHPMQTNYIKVRGVTDNKVRITQYENGSEKADSTAIFTGYSRSVR